MVFPKVRLEQDAVGGLQVHCSFVGSHGAIGFGREANSLRFELRPAAFEEVQIDPEWQRTFCVLKNFSLGSRSCQPLYLSRYLPGVI